MKTPESDFAPGWIERALAAINSVLADPPNVELKPATLAEPPSDISQFQHQEIP